MKPSPVNIPDVAAAGATFRLPRPPRAVVFDLDGTLIDSEALVLDAYMEAARRHRTPFSHEQFLQLVGRSRPQSEAKMREFFGPDFPLETFYAAVSEHIGDRAAPLKAGAEDVLGHLDRAGAPYALATSSGRPWVEKHFRAHGLGGRFRNIVTRDDVANGKPHPEPYLKASTLLGHAPPHVLAIEDSPTGVASAHAAGLMTVMVPDLLTPDPEARAKALHVATSLQDVLAMLQAR